MNAGPGVVDQDVQAAERLGGLAGDRPGVGGDVGVEGGHGQALAGQLADRRRVAGGVPGHDDHLGPGLGEGDGEGLAQALVPAGNQGLLAGQRETL